MSSRCFIAPMALFFSISGARLGVTATSHTILRGAVQGDAESWSRIAYLYAPLIAKWGRNRGVPATDLEDYVQSVFASLVVSIASYNREVAPFRAWLKTICERRVVDYFRKATRASNLGDRTAEVPSWEEPDSDEWEQSKAMVFVRACEMIRSEFAERTFEMFSMTALEGKETSEVAEVMGVTSATVRKAKSRVVIRLREVLADELIEGTNETETA